MSIEKYLNRILCGDNVEILKSFPDECIDLTVTSPPYDDMGEDFIPISKGGLRVYNGYSWDFKGLAAELYRVTKPGGVVVWVVNDPTIDGSESLASSLQKIYFRRMGFNVETMIYKAEKPPVNDDRYQPSFEYMIVLSKGRIEKHNLLKDKKNKQAGLAGFGTRTHRGKNGELRKSKKTITPDYSIRLNIWEYATGRGNSASDNYAYEHPAIFPEDLARDHILSWSNAGDIVLDPFSGSGTTAKKSKELGREFIGIDISEEYCKLSEKRIAATNPPLFTLEVE